MTIGEMARERVRNLAVYTPSEADTADADIERFLRATVTTYTDGQGGDKTARAVSVKPVQDAGGGAENGSPDFEEELERKDRTGGCAGRYARRQRSGSVGRPWVHRQRHPDVRPPCSHSRGLGRIFLRLTGLA